MYRAIVEAETVLLSLWNDKRKMGELLKEMIDRILTGMAKGEAAKKIEEMVKPARKRSRGKR